MFLKSFAVIWFPYKRTPFLDDVGEIPPELQPKPLRFLQEQEFERLGSAKTIRVNVRMVGATSRDLSQMVADDKSRSDVYHRQNIFPVCVPPLRSVDSPIPRYESLDLPPAVMLEFRHLTIFHERRVLPKRPERIGDGPQQYC
jgi:Sigma-54 interaction domain